MKYSGAKISLLLLLPKLKQSRKSEPQPKRLVHGQYETRNWRIRAKVISCGGIRKLKKTFSSRAISTIRVCIELLSLSLSPSAKITGVETLKWEKGRQHRKKSSWWRMDPILGPTVPTTPCYNFGLLTFYIKCQLQIIRKTWLERVLLFSFLPHPHPIQKFQFNLDAGFCMKVWLCNSTTQDVFSFCPHLFFTGVFRTTRDVLRTSAELLAVYLLQLLFSLFRFR